MSADIYFPSGSGGWSLDQLFDFFPSDDNDISKADEGLPGVSIKSETQADAPVGLEALCTSPTEGSLGLDWMEQDFDFGFTPMSLDDDLPCKPASTTLPTVAASISTSPDGRVELENLHKEFADEFLHNLNETLLKQETSPSPSSYQEPTPEIHVTPEIILDAIDTSASSPSCQDALEIHVTSEMVLEADENSALQVLQNGNIEFLQCPLTSDDVESLLSSASSLEPSPAPTPSPAPSSPAPSSPATVDTSLSDSGYLSLNSSDLYKVVENTDKSRPTPYSRPKSSKNTKSKGRKQTASIAPTPTDLELEFMSKKDRKKLQNKNAAIRYRQKKKAETEDKRSEVDELEKINNDLHAKCEELQREVKCMKDLINDIRKAKGQPPLKL